MSRTHRFVDNSEFEEKAENPIKAKFYVMGPDEPKTTRDVVAELLGILAESERKESEK